MKKIIESENYGWLGTESSWSRRFIIDLITFDGRNRVLSIIKRQCACHVQVSFLILIVPSLLLAALIQNT